MKLILALIFLLMSQLCFGATAQVNNIVQKGGAAANSTSAATVPAGAALFTIKMSVNGSSPCTSGNACHFYYKSAIYQVTNGSKFCGVSTSYKNYTSGSSCGTLFYSTTAYADNATTGSLTSPQYEFGHSASGGYNVQTAGQWETTNETDEYPSQALPGLIVETVGCEMRQLGYETTGNCL